MLDLLRPEHAYLFGFAQGDGTLSENTRNRGRFSIEIGSRDEHILLRFQELISCYSAIRRRERSTNFAASYRSSQLTVCNRAFRECLISLGFPVGKKHLLIRPPTVPFSAVDYYRGLVDADGSVGLTNQGLPFIALCASSPAIIDAYQEFLKPVIGIRKNTQPNRRDGVANIIVLRGRAQLAIRALYYPGALALKRKADAAAIALRWSPPPRGRRVWNRWTGEEDAVIVAHSPVGAAALLSDRSLSAVYSRRVELRRAGKLPSV